MLPRFFALMVLAAPPAGGEDAERAILQVINASEAGSVQLADVEAVAALAARELLSAPPREQSSRLGYVKRTHEILSNINPVKGPDYACAEIATLAAFGARGDVSADLKARAERRQAGLRDALAKRDPLHTCPTPNEAESSQPTQIEPPLAPTTSEPPPLVPVGRSIPAQAAPNARSRSMIVGGSVLLGTGALFAVGAIGTNSWYGNKRDDLTHLAEEIAAAGGKTQGQVDQRNALEQTLNLARGLTIGAAVLAAAQGVAGIALLARGAARRTQRAKVSPTGGPYSVGITIEGRF
ncbi:hypothetical protein [Nannocystis radixulma]|uniref:Uncharacterized protein n=1 Tax=Nannocystis radixulma TaxID=2995305 RepID=A0ABT5AZ23_9BACT|nr:hypothetical protein [Nannocystis radixulma]MDC0667085.1 hypothetical protein [Nannocystis radixulma]